MEAEGLTYLHAEWTQHPATCDCAFNAINWAEEEKLTDDPMSSQVQDRVKLVVPVRGREEIVGVGVVETWRALYGRHRGVRGSGTD